MVAKRERQSIPSQRAVYHSGERRQWPRDLAGAPLPDPASTGEPRGQLTQVAPRYVAHALPLRDPRSGNTVLALSLREPVRCTLTLAWARGAERPQALYQVGGRRGTRMPDLGLRTAILRHAVQQCAWLAYIRRGDGGEAILHDAPTLLLAELAAVQDERLARLSPTECREAAALDAAVDRAAVEYRHVMDTETEERR